MTNPYQSSDSINSPQGTTACRGCGKELHVTATTCPNCGASQRSRGYKSKGVAALLAFFFGGLGIHRFYLGQWWGIFYLLFIWTWIPGLISLIETIVFLATDRVKWDQKHNEGKPAGPGEGAGVGIVVGIVVGLFVMIAMIGILAAIAIPAYQDYTYRSKVAQAMSEISPIKSDYVAYLNERQQAPRNNGDLGLDSPLTLSSGHKVTISNELIFIEFVTPKSNLIDGETLTFSPVISGNQISWDCTGGTLANKYRPRQCRP